MWKIIKEKIRKSRADNKKQKAIETFNVTEHNGELWLTFLSNRVCPCSMLKEEPVLALHKMRELFENE